MSARGSRAERERRRGEQLAELYRYYATGNGREVPVERVAAHCGVSLEIARHQLRINGRKL